MTASPAQPPSTPAPARPGPAAASDRRTDGASQAADGFAILLAGLAPAQPTSAPAPHHDGDTDAQGPPDAGATAPVAGLAPVSDQGAAPAALTPAGPVGLPAAVAGPLPATPALAPADPADTPAAVADPLIATPTLASSAGEVVPQPQAGGANAAGGLRAPQGSLPEGAAPAGVPPAVTSSPDPVLAPELASAAPPAAGVIDPRRLQAAIRTPDQTDGTALAAPSSAKPPAAAPAPPPANPAVAPDSSPGPDARSSPAPKPDASAVAASGLRAAASPASAVRPAAPPTPDGPAATDARIELPADLNPATSIRPGGAPSQPIAAAQQSAPPPPPVPVAVQLGVQIAAAAPHRIERLFVQLEPPALGRVEVRLEFSRDNRVSAVIAADRHDTLDVLQRDSGTLQRALQDAGLRLNDNGLSFSLRQDQRQQERGAGTPYPLRLDPGAEATPASGEAPPVYWFGAQRVLDIRI
jgi:flagellar hook-length control protein FliK